MIINVFARTPGWPGTSSGPRIYMCFGNAFARIDLWEDPDWYTMLWGYDTLQERRRKRLV